MKTYDKNSNKGYILEVNIEYPKNLHDLHSHSDLPFLPERIEIRKMQQAIVCNLCDKNNYVVYISPLKQPLNYGLVLKKLHRVV